MLIGRIWHLSWDSSEIVSLTVSVLCGSMKEFNWNSRFWNTLETFQLMLMSHYWNQVVGILVIFFWKLNFPLFILQNYFCKVILQALKYLIDLNLSTALPKVTKLSALLLTVPKTSSLNWNSLLWRSVLNLHSIQTQERFTPTTLSWTRIEKNFFKMQSALQTSVTLCWDRYFQLGGWGGGGTWNTSTRRNKKKGKLNIC